MAEEVVLSIIGLAVTIVGMFGSSLYWLGRKFAEIDKKFEAIDRRFEEIDKRFEAVERRFDEFDRKLASFADSVRSAVVAMNSAVIEFLGLKGLITQGETSFLIREVMRMSQAIRSNPISKEEAEFIRAVFAKGDIDKITVEELEKVAEIVKRWWYEEGSELAYKMFLYVWMLRAYKLFSQQEKR
ncbi:hypothetical protein [Pyrobaculum aerophilum]|uniref:hypothetical protein n=1 Tax=Pyrobaculum aerophilum TaxID=13773 RepID=UPI0023F19879|nr:hypothetical protein [Pyrobaculum aerophilum]MCX8136887.1 hypothetical protein [Pyrobaculum aerophilum]